MTRKQRDKAARENLDDSYIKKLLGASYRRQLKKLSVPLSAKEKALLPLLLDDGKFRSLCRSHLKELRKAHSDLKAGKSAPGKEARKASDRAQEMIRTWVKLAVRQAGRPHN